MELSSSRVSVGSDDYNLITNEKCNPPRAKLFIVFLVSLVVATLIVLLVVQLDECADVAIIGAGLAGSYAAWRMRHTNQSVILYEMANRVGGQFQDVSDLTYTAKRIQPLGASFFMPDLHPLMYKTISSLRLDTEPYVKFGGEELYLRRRKMIHSTCYSDTDCSYNMDLPEFNKTALDLLREILQLNTNDVEEFNTTDSSLVNSSDWSHLLYHESMKNFIIERSSYEAYQFLRDSLTWWQYQPEGNMESLLIYLQHMNEIAPADDNLEKLALTRGMGGLVDELIKQTQLHHRTFQLKTQMELESVESEPTFHYLHFKPYFSTRQESNCAKTVILALPPKQVNKLTFNPELVQTEWPNLRDILQDIPLLKVIIEYNTSEALDGNNTFFWGSVTTDLPIQQVTITDSFCDNVTKEKNYTYDALVTTTTSDQMDYLQYTENITEIACYNVVELTINRDNMDYWLDLLQIDGYDIVDDVISIDVTSSRFVQQIGRHLEEISGAVDQFKLPKSAFVKLWGGASNSPGISLWKPGVNITMQSEYLRTPIDRVSMHLIGSAYAPHYLQCWGEGALTTVEKLVNEGIIN